MRIECYSNEIQATLSDKFPTGCALTDEKDFFCADLLFHIFIKTAIIKIPRVAVSMFGTLRLMAR